MNVINLIKQKMIKTPWLKFYKKEDKKIKVEDISIYDALVKNNVGRDKNIAITNDTFLKLSHILQNNAKKLNIKVDKKTTILLDFLCKLNISTLL